MAVGLGALVVLSAIHIMWGGTIRFTLPELYAGLVGGDSELAGQILWRLRFPRVVAGIVVGAGLATAGCVFQTLFRNPLAEPYVIGVSSGAGVGGALALALGIGAWAGGLGLALAGSAGGLLTLAMVMALSAWRKRTDVVRLLLSGVVVGSMLAAATTLIILFAGHDSNVVLRWLLGSFTPMSWPRIGAMVVTSAVAFVVGIRAARRLNVFAYGPELAGRLGLVVGREAGIQLFVFTVAVGTIVGSAGIIGFVGLIAPHIARSLVGPDLRRSLPVSAIVGSSGMVLADLLAQKILPGTELPVGAVTALIGAPVLLILLQRGVYRLSADSTA